MIVIMIMLACLELLWQKDGVITAILSPLDDLSAGCGDGEMCGFERANNQMGGADGHGLEKRQMF